ncbi:MAG: MFS transporter [Bacteroidales bacterium]|nr:MFS transporter [Bacteroidales bacterium]
MWSTLLSNEAFAVIRVKNFRFFLGYRFFMTMATLMQSVIVGWHVYFLTKNVFWLGLIGLVEVIPQFSISLFAGHYIDLWNRKKIISITTLLLLLGSAILYIYSIESLHCYNQFGIWPIFVTIFLTGLSRGILMPAHTALLGQLIKKELYANGATWSSVNWHIGAVLGPAVGGIIYAFGGVKTAYLSVFILYFISLLMILGMQINPIQRENASSEEGIFARIKEGINFVLKTPELVGAFSLDMFAVLFGGAVAMLPVFASDVLHVGPEGLGFLRACPAIGAIIMSTFLMFNPPMKNSGKLLLGAVSGFGLCMIGFALSESFWLSAALLFLSGFFDNVSVVIRGTILQLYTPDNMRGRVASVNSIFIGSSNELGSFESGVAAKWMGLIPSVVFGGVMTLIVVGVMSKINPTLRHLSLKK